MIKIKKQRYNITLTEEQRKIVEKIAREEKCSLSEVVGYAILLLDKNLTWKN